MANSIGLLPIVGGVTVVAFASGFSVCMFNVDTVGDCVTLARTWVDTFKDAGIEIIKWGFALFTASRAQ